MDKRNIVLPMQLTEATNWLSDFLIKISVITDKLVEEGLTLLIFKNDSYTYSRFIRGAQVSNKISRTVEKLIRNIFMEASI